MKLNVGTFDRFGRILFAAAVAVLYFAEVISGTTALVLGALAVILAVTGGMGFCPIYFATGFSTRKSVETEPYKAH